MTKPTRNVAASVRARLLALAKARGEDFQLVLTRYANERLLYRLSRSVHAATFVLKGATLFLVWTDKPHRVTRDVDLLGFGSPSVDRIRSVLADVLAVEVADDGVVFDVATLEVGPIREDQEYGGIRAVVFARVTAAKVRLQIDVGFGDVIVAEKLEALVQLGVANSRMKDFYDLAILSRLFEFDGALLTRAIRATFERRKTPLPTELPAGLTTAFTTDPAKVAQWIAFVRKSGAHEIADLAGAAAEITGFVQRPLLAAARGESFAMRWPRLGPWER